LCACSLPVLVLAWGVAVRCGKSCDVAGVGDCRLSWHYHTVTCSLGDLTWILIWAVTYLLGIVWCCRQPAFEIGKELIQLGVCTIDFRLIAMELETFSRLRFRFTGEGVG
jgi:hypothetical protein